MPLALIPTVIVLGWPPAAQARAIAQFSHDVPGSLVIDCDLNAALTLDEHLHESTEDNEQPETHHDDHQADDIYRPFLQAMQNAIAAQPPQIIIRALGATEGMLIDDALSLQDEEQESALSDALELKICTVVQGNDLIPTLIQADFLQQHQLAADTDDDRTLADLLISHIEVADEIMLHMPQGSHDEPHQHTQIAALLAQLNPAALILPHSASSAQVKSWRYRQSQPFHPVRFWQLIHSDWLQQSGQVIRSYGAFWLASRPDQAGEWSQAGGACRHAGAGRWGELFDQAGQDLTFIGLHLNTPALQKQLDACLLQVNEAIPLVAVDNDPFPAWE